MQAQETTAAGESGMAAVRRLGDRTLRLLKTDLTELDVDAFVFYAQHDLVLGAGFGNMITVRGGPTIQKELKGHEPVQTCDVVLSDAGELKARHIIHAVGPRFREPHTEDKLRLTMRNVLDLAREKGVKTLAFPPMGTGFYGIPLDLSARVMCEEIERCLAGDTTLEEVSICVMDKREWTPFHERIAGGAA